MIHGSRPMKESGAGVCGDKILILFLPFTLTLNTNILFPNPTITIKSEDNR